MLVSSWMFVGRFGVLQQVVVVVVVLVWRWRR